MNLTSYYTTFHDPIWVILLSIALFFPVRQLIWVLYVRKKQKSQQTVSEEERKVLKKRENGHLQVKSLKKRKHGQVQGAERVGVQQCAGARKMLLGGNLGH